MSKDIKALVKAVAKDVQSTLKGKVDENLTTYTDYIRDREPVEFISTGNLAIDRIFGGGVPVGRMVELFGPFSSGKSTLLYEIMAQVCKLGGLCMLQDTETTYDPRFGERIGIDPEALLYSKPRTVEDAFRGQYETIQALRRHDKKRLLCIGMDSLAATSTKHELKELDKADMTKAKAIGAWLRRLTPLVNTERVVFIIVNQTRHKVGMMFGNPETRPGGDAPEFHASLLVRVNHGSLYKGHAAKLRAGGKVVAIRIVVETVKNKVAPPFRKCEIIQNFRDGILPWSGMADLLADEEIITVGMGRPDGEGRAARNGIFKFKDRTFKAYEIQSVLDEYPELAIQQVWR